MADGGKSVVQVAMAGAGLILSASCAGEEENREKRKTRSIHGTLLGFCAVLDAGRP
jgi:hypothetical protein